jgi:DNA-binding NtrC family response regulator
VPETLLEAELFGHRRGAFSGAVEDRLGLVRAAHHGTLLLDEIRRAAGRIAGRVSARASGAGGGPVGGAEAVKVDVRLCVATNADLEALVAKGAFREDLYARLGGLVVRLPPLRDRREDLGLLIGAILRRGGVTRKARFTPAAMRRLFWYGWPRNIRELERCIDTAEALAAKAPIDLAHLPEVPRAARPPHERVAAELTAEERQQRDQLAALLEEHDGNVAAVARAMGQGAHAGPSLDPPLRACASPSSADA